MSARAINKLAQIIFNASWGVTGLKYSPRCRSSDWRSRDARRAAECVMSQYDLEPKNAVSADS